MKKTYRNKITVRGSASEFIAHLPDLLNRKESRKVVLYLRESTRAQEARGNLRAAREHALAELKKNRCLVAAIFSEITNSSIFQRREQLERAIDYAREQNAILVSPSRDRFLRSRDFDGKNRTENPRIFEYLRFKRMTQGLNVATILHPNCSARSAQIRIGLKAKRAQSGRPPSETVGAGWAKRRRERFRFMAKRFKRCGLSYAEIADHIGVAYKRWPKPTEMTVWNWLNPGI